MYTNKEKYRFACSFLPSPYDLATMAVPPVPNINPTVPKIIKNGMARFTALKGISPAKLDTKKPSTTLYRDVNIIIAMDGKVNLISFL